MSVTSILRDPPNNVCIVRLTVDGLLSQVTVPGYVVQQAPIIKKIVGGDWTWHYSDVLLVSADDNTGFFQFNDPSLTTLIPVSENSMNRGSFYSVYVAHDGSDLTGDGSIIDPYQTIAHAISTINTASSSFPFQIICVSGVYNEPSLALKPFVSINGNNSVLNVTGNITADSIWSSGGIIYFENFNQINVSGLFDFDLSTSGSNTCVINMLNLEFLTTSSISIVGSNNVILVAEGIDSFSGGLTINVTNAYGALEACAPLNFNYTASLVSQSFVFQLLNCLILNNIDITSTLASSGVSFNIFNTPTENTITATGANVALNISSDSVSSTSIPVVSGGATVNYINVSDGINANYTPVNYIPVATPPTVTTSVQAHLHGIDNALGSTTGITSNGVYVSILGNDITGNGSIEKPFATVAYAISSITTATSSNIFNVILLDGTYVESVQILLKPWVNLIGQNTNTVINNSSDIILDSSWNTTTDAIISLANLFISNNLTIDYTTVPAASSTGLLINNVVVDTNLNVNGSFGNVNVIFITASTIINATINNLPFLISNANFYEDGFTAGTISFTNGTYFQSIGDYFGGLILNGATVGPTQQIYTINSAFINGAFDVTGAQAVVNIDVSSYIPPTVSGGALIQLPNISDSLTANYSPSNYTPISTPPTLPTSVQAHLHGIDNALMGISTPYNVYVSVSGNDSTGNGSLNKPFLTIAHAMSTITTATASNNVNIMLLDGIYNEAVQIVYKPYVNLIGLTPFNTEINNSSDIILSSGWNIGGDPSAYIINVLIAGNLNFDLTPYTSASGAFFGLFNTWIFGTTTINGGLNNAPAGSGCYAYIYNSLLYVVNIDNVENHNSVGTMYHDINTYGGGGGSNIQVLNFKGDRFSSNLNLIGNGVAPQTVTLSACNFEGLNPVGITGPNMTAYIDALSWMNPTLSGSPVINLTTVSNGIDANYIPANYTPVTTAPTLVTSLEAHLNGIDNALTQNSDLSKTILTPTTGNTITLSTANRRTILNPAGTLATLTVDMPATPVNGQLQTVSTTQIITSLTVSGNGHTIIGQPTTLTVGQSFTMIYDLGTTTWYPG